MKINQPIVDAVRAGLDGDPRLPHADEIAVTAYGNEVTLRGTVGSFAELRAAVSDARAIVGVVAVVAELQVRILDHDRREDAEIRGAALQRLVRDSSIPGDDLDVRVLNGWVTLRGDVDFQSQSDIAFDHVARVRGVTGVTNEIEVGRARETSDRLNKMGLSIGPVLTALPRMPGLGADCGPERARGGRRRAGWGDRASARRLPIDEPSLGHPRMVIPGCCPCRRAMVRHLGLGHDRPRAGGRGRDRSRMGRLRAAAEAVLRGAGAERRRCRASLAAGAARERAIARRLEGDIARYCATVASGVAATRRS